MGSVCIGSVCGECVWGVCVGSVCVECVESVSVECGDGRVFDRVDWLKQC